MLFAYLLLNQHHLLKALSQMLQMKGFSPKCFLLCRVSSSDLENLQSQSVQGHWNGFSPVWVLVCACNRSDSGEISRIIYHIIIYIILYESGALVPRAFPSKRQFVSERLNAFKLSSYGVTLSPYIIDSVHEEELSYFKLWRHLLIQIYTV